jgi:hypothetical protein
MQLATLQRGDLIVITPLFIVLKSDQGLYMCMYEDFLLNQYKEKFLLNIVKVLTRVELQHILVMH